MEERFDRIFIVDDDEAARETLSELLLMDSFKVESAGTAEKTLEKIKSWPAHLFIIDLRMPGMGGIELLKMLDIKNNSYEAIIITGYADLESAKQAMQFGAFSYISKPVMYDELAPLINKALEVAALKKSKINHLNELEEKIRERTKELEKEIAEKRIAEKTLIRSEERYRRLFEESNDAVFIHNAQGEILSVNQAACDMLGYDFQTLTVMKIPMLHPPEEQPKAKSALKNMAKTEKNRFESKLNRAEGTPIDVEISARIIDKEDGLIQGIVRDITERKKAEEALKESNEFLNNLIGSIRDGLSVLDENGVHIRVNSAFCRMTGFKNGELIGTGPPHPYWPEEEYDNIQKTFKKTLNEDFEEVETVFKRKNGDRFPVIINPSSVKDSNGKVISYFSTVRDITARKQAEEALREKEKKLSEQNVMLQEKNIALREVMDQFEAESGRLGKQISSNVDRLVLPLILRLRSKGSSIDTIYLDLLEENLKEIASQFGGKLSDRMLKLTQKEIEMCAMIKQGLTSKEIAKLLTISHRTVETHRNNIRKKLGIGKQEVNLVTYLKNLA